MRNHARRHKHEALDTILLARRNIYGNKPAK